MLFAVAMFPDRRVPLHKDIRFVFGWEARGSEDTVGRAYLICPKSATIVVQIQDNWYNITNKRRSDIRKKIKHYKK